MKKIIGKQEKDLAYHNKNRTQFKKYEVGEEIYVNINKIYESKLTHRYKKEIVKEDKGS